MDYPLVSVIILNYNGLKNLNGILEECVKSALNTEYPNFELLFVDNASTDRSIEFVKKNFGRNPILRIIQNEKNFGFAGGINVGIKKAKGEYIALLNNDTIVDTQWLKELVKVMQQPRVGAAQSKLLQLRNPNILDCAGGFIDYLGYAYERGRGQKASDYKKVDEIFYAKGASLIIKRAVLDRVGYFDPILFIYYDETDLCWRVWLNGYKVVFVPTSIVYHAQGVTISTLPEHVSLYFLTRNHMLLLIKNYDRKNLVKNLIAFLLMEFRKAAVFIAKRKCTCALSIIKALTWNLIHFKYAWQKRCTVQKLIRRVPDHKIQKVMVKPYPPFPHSLIFRKSYFIKK